MGRPWRRGVSGASWTLEDSAEKIEARRPQPGKRGPHKKAQKMRVKLPKPVAAIYRAVEELDEIYRDYGRKFTPDGHLVGSIGEVIAAEALGLKLRRGSYPGHDAVDRDNRDVQIKMTAGRSVALYDTCDRLIVLKVVDPEYAEIVYDGPGAPVWQHAGRMQKNGQRTISLTKLRSLIQN